ncbi:hypothetical protein DYB25_006883 [Aphanomyces astaci]|uniref:Uncharacterized protein n=1 Tax=Aphanomyces astaci TaxID=112090 RepID=A0A397A3Y0_APHAT|nr:hypothetical protein DYB25_006883 [Aphanomyces astaci]
MSDPHRKDRKWSSKPGAPPVTTIPSMASMADASTPKSSGASSVENTPAMEKQLQYLRKLEERNRIKKKLDEQSKNDKDVHDKEKEVGFTTNFNGENAHRKNKHARMPEAKARAKSAGPMKLPLRTAPGNGDDNPEPEDVDEDYMDESFEEFEDNSTGDEHMWSKEGQHYHGRHDDDEVNDVTPPPTVHAVVLAEPSPPVAAALESQVANLPLGQTTLELNALIQGLTRDKQRELVSVLETLTHSSKQYVVFYILSQDTRAWEAEVTRKLEFERHESMRLVAEAEARRAERLKKLQDEEIEFETLMAQRRLDMQKKWMDATTSSFTTNTAAVTALAAPVPMPKASLMATKSTQEDVPIQPEGPDRPVPPPPQAFMAMPIPTGSPPKPQPSTSSHVALPSQVSMSLGLPPAAPTIPTSSQVKQSTSSSLSVSKPPRWIEVRIKLLSSWGKSRVVGLTQVGGNMMFLSHYQ